MTAEFAVTEVAHPALRDVRGECVDCLSAARDAAVHARVTGSTGANYVWGDHFATVKRAITIIDLDSE